MRYVVTFCTCHAPSRQATADRQEIAANYRMNVLGYLRYFEKKHTPRP